ncbi:hypothetical protein [Actinoplanes sp. NBRC 101535]|uniref:hypothetical protein n=1 Tax=Actinoplanes sp. NBRC 101535 TaxID=3032196 RepID=UPI0024A1DC67|nr:hypothetical protein [Actinoplanes sp. NBRC 101535]GLY03858.1 hypothetical protein Acsp01_42370 [Actinoplanes sp. NBRC 101535]
MRGVEGELGLVKVELDWARELRRAAAVLCTLLALAGAVRLCVPANPDDQNQEPSGVRRQLTFLKQELASGADTEAQEQFPEGYYFLNVLYGLSWVELGQRGVEPVRAAEEAEWALARVESEAGRAPFDAGATPAYGVFYAGWTNWLRGGLLTLRKDPKQEARFLADSEALAGAFTAAASPFLPAYPGEAWPCDSTVAIASLRLADGLSGRTRFTPVVDRWVSRVKGLVDPETGLLPHQVDAVTGRAQSGARGSSQAIIQRFLPDVDPKFARQQYELFRDQFLDRPLGLVPAVREYPHGVDGVADVDSGPLLLGVSLSATVVAMGAAQAQGDRSLASALGNVGEVAGVPLDMPSTKRYAFGAVPVGDAFLAWSKTARSWTGFGVSPPAPVIDGWWRVPLLALFLLLGLAPWLPGLYRRSPLAVATPARKSRPVRKATASKAPVVTRMASAKAVPAAKRTTKAAPVTKAAVKKVAKAAPVKKVAKAAPVTKVAKAAVTKAAKAAPVAGRKAAPKPKPPAVPAKKAAPARPRPKK